MSSFCRNPASRASTSRSSAVRRGPITVDLGDTVRSAEVSHSDTGSLMWGRVSPCSQLMVRNDMVGAAGHCTSSSSTSAPCSSRLAKRRGRLLAACQGCSGKGSQSESSMPRKTSAARQSRAICGHCSANQST